MKVDPYIPLSVRTKAAWKRAGEILGLHPVVVREGFLQDWFRVMESKTFFTLLESGEIKKEEFDSVKFTDEQINEKQKIWDDALKESEDTDLMDYELKQLIEVGDEILSTDTKKFLSGGEYITTGKRYKIKELHDDGLTGFSAITSTNMKGERNWECVHGVRSLWRKGKEIWNWNIAYFEMFKRMNPNHPQTKEMEEHCLIQAEKIRQGKKD
jgi:hypothetical protein